MNIDKISHQYHLLEGFCRGCLVKYDNPTDLLQYTEKNRRLFVYSTGLQVKRNDLLTFQLCKNCYVNMKFSCKFKKQCRTSDKRFKNYLRLKEICDIDLCTFLKNSDDTLKFPLLCGSSTPANQRNKDDDNESTCTSIQNFMTDILQGTEMPDTEARIIKEVIEEEADVLEESLDSHWLQDDVCIDTDFRLDFSFSPFSTSRSVNNNHCFTPSKQFEFNQNSNNNHPKKVLDQLPTLREIDYRNSPKNISLNGINEALRDICGETQIDIEEDYMQDNLKEECINANQVIPMFLTDPNMPELIDETENNFNVQSEIDIAVKNIDMNFGNVDKHLYGLDNLTADMNFDNVPGADKKNLYVLNDSTVSDEMKVDDVTHQTDTVLHDDVTERDTIECSIDKNLTKALVNNNREIPLEDLLASPALDILEAGVSTPKIDDFAVVIGASTPKIDSYSEDFRVATPKINPFANEGRASTPVINNILFGAKLLDEDSNNGHKVGQCIETFENVGGDIDILEEFFNEGVKEFDQNENSGTGVTETNVTDNQVLEFAKGVKPVDNSEYYDIEKLLCNICDKKYLNEKAIKSHMVKIHQIKVPKKKYVETRQLMCPHCGIVKLDRGNFSKHVKSHEMLRKVYTCTVCTLTFPSEATLKQHSRVHNTLLATKEKKKKQKFICSTCGATFEFASNLASHARRHAAPARACAHCRMAFHTNYELKRHERIHTGERPHTCPVPACSRSFVTKYNLVTHMRKHTAEKPFQCDYCSVKFSKKSNLVKHIQTSTKCLAKRAGEKKQKRVKSYACYFCKHQYTTKGHLIKHQQRSAACIKKREESENMNRSTIKVQMPYLYPETANTEVTPASMFKIRVLNEEEQNSRI